MIPHIQFMHAKDAAVTFHLPGAKAANGAPILDADVMALQVRSEDGLALVGEPGAIRSLAMKMIRATVLAEVKIAENKKKAESK